MSAAEALARLSEKRDRAIGRVDELEGEARTAGQAAVEASAALAEAERRGVKAAERRELEEALFAARVKASEPWPERIEGARAAVRDAEREVQKFRAAHLSELVEALEEDGRIAVATLNATAEAMVTAFIERERIAHEISVMAGSVGRIHPGDVSFTHAEALVREARALVDAGGEAPPVLRHDPREPRLGSPVEQSAA
jgi:hypothetical protein